MGCFFGLGFGLFAGCVFSRLFAFIPVFSRLFAFNPVYSRYTEVFFLCKDGKDDLMIVPRLALGFLKKQKQALMAAGQKQLKMCTQKEKQVHLWKPETSNSNFCSLFLRLIFCVEA